MPACRRKGRPCGAPASFSTARRLRAPARKADAGAGPCASGRRGRSGNGAVCCGLYGVFAYLGAACGVQRGAFARPNRRGQTARTCPGPVKGPGRRLWNARQNSFSAICEFHNNKSGKHFSNTFIFGIMYAVKIGLSTRFGAFQRARPRPCESTLRGGGRPGCVLRVQPQPD